MLFHTTKKLFTKIAGLHRPVALAALSRGVSTYGRQAQSRLAGKTVLLTGASAGIGAATALGAGGRRCGRFTTHSGGAPHRPTKCAGW